ncbi:MAG: hypothetical protein QW734_07890 [Candidatus Bathyarchaeia archaeon]
MSGVLSDLFKNTPLGGLGITPQITQKEITIELTEAQFKELVFSGMKPEERDRAMRYIDVSIKEGKIIVKVRLF